MKNPKRQVLFLWTILCSVLPLWSHAEEISPSRKKAANRPNIILIMADDLGWKDLHCYGNSMVDTPAIDRLAKSGMRFTDAYSASPVCTPTRAALMTGLSPARLQITNHAGGHPPGFRLPQSDLESAAWTRHLPLAEVTLAEHLKQAGYATGFFGKWHLSHRPRGAGEPSEPNLRPQHQGFDVNVGGCDFGGPPSYFSPYKNPELEDDGNPYLPDLLAEACVTFIRDHQSEPFFVCWWNYSVHYPFQAPDSLIKKYEQRQKAEDTSLKNPTYAAMIEGMDRSVGHLMKAVHAMGLDDNTLVIFTSDNGPFAADVRPLRAEKGHLYEGGIRVPLIVRWPGVTKPETICKTPVITMDLFQTIYEAARLPAASISSDGLNIKPLLDQPNNWPERALFFHYPNYAFHKKNRLGSAMREGDYKLVYFYDDEKSELYNLSDDISEAIDLSQSEPERTLRMENQLKAWLNKTGANRPVRKSQ